MLSENKIKELFKEELEKTVKLLDLDSLYYAEHKDKAIAYATVLEDTDMVKRLTYGDINIYKAILKEL